jgi:hypothetical protein
MGRTLEEQFGRIIYQQISMSKPDIIEKILIYEICSTLVFTIYLSYLPLLVRII